MFDFMTGLMLAMPFLTLISFLIAVHGYYTKEPANYFAGVGFTLLTTGLWAFLEHLFTSEISLVLGAAAGVNMANMVTFTVLTESKPNSHGWEPWLVVVCGLGGLFVSVLYGQTLTIWFLAVITFGLMEINQRPVVK